MTKYKLEYIWLDGYKPVPNLRGKTQIKEFSSFPTLEQLPLWGFDGSSTMQAEGHSSDCVLKPVAISPDAESIDGALDKQALHHSGRCLRLVRLRTGIFLLQGWTSSRLPAFWLSRSAGALLY